MMGGTYKEVVYDNMRNIVTCFIRVKQIISLVKNSSTNRNDIVEIKYEVSNEGESSSSFGFSANTTGFAGNSGNVVTEPVGYALYYIGLD